MGKTFEVNDLVRSLKDREEYLIEEKIEYYDVNLGESIFNGKYRCRRVKEYQNPSVYVFEENELELIE